MIPRLFHASFRIAALYADEQVLEWVVSSWDSVLFADIFLSCSVPISYRRLHAFCPDLDFFSSVVLAGLNYKLPLLHSIDAFKCGTEICDDEKDE